MEARFRVFGGLRVWVDHEEVAVRPARAVPLLSALVLARGETVSVADLLDAIWGPGLPPSAVNQLHRLVGMARRLLQPGLSSRESGELIVGSPGGYRLGATGVDSDLVAFDEAVAAGREALAAGDPRVALRRYCAALEISELPPGDSLSGSSVALRAVIAGVEKDRIEIVSDALELARPSDLLPAVIRYAESVADAHPFEEQVHARLISALGFVGRRAEALARFDRVRERLVDEMGMDPGAELIAAHMEVLGPAGSTGPVVLAVPVPRELPSLVRGYVERPDVRASLGSLTDPDSPPAGRVIVLTGLGGVGKTALAVRLAHELASRFPDGQLFVNLRGFDADGRVVQPLDAVTTLLASLDVASPDAVSSLDSRSALLRSALADKRVLILLDNAHDAEQVRPLLPGSPHCLVIVTSRVRLAGLVVREGAESVLVGPMTDDLGLQLLVNRVGEGRLDVERGATSKVLAACGGLPLALSIVAARIAMNPRFTVHEVTHSIVGAEASRSRSLAGWHDDDASSDVGSVLTWSYDALAPEARRALRLIAVHYGPTMSTRSIASAVGLPLAEAARLVDVLLDASLLEQTGPGIFRMHDLVAAFAADLARLDPERESAERRLIGHFVHSTRAAWNVFGRPAVGDLEGPEPGVHAETFGSADDAHEWYDHKRADLIATLYRACELGLDGAAAHIAIDWRPMNQALDPAADTQPYAIVALAAAERHGDPVLEAELHRDVGGRAGRLRDFDVSTAHLEKAILAFRAAEDLIGEANTLRNLGASAMIQGDMTLAHQYAREGLVVARAASSPQVLAVALRAVAWHLTELGRYDEAELSLTEALDLTQSLGLSYLESEIRGELAVVCINLQRPKDAWEHTQRGLETVTVDQSQRFLLNVQAAKAAIDLGDRSAAAQACRLARNYLDGLVEDLDPGDGWDSDLETLAGVEAELAAG